MPPVPLKYPLKSHRKKINIPSNGIGLAEFLGIEFGDGGIGNIWQLVISLNSVLDLEYANYIVNLGFKLFGIKPAIRKRPNQNTLVLVYSSTQLVDFIVTKGAVRGNKISQSIDIPDWIKGKPKYEKSFVRGLIDTDGCLFIHKHTLKGTLYQNLGLCFTSFSTKLTSSVANILLENGIKPYITNQKTRIYLYSAKSVVKYLEVFGSSNPRITNKFLEWRSRIVA